MTKDEQSTLFYRSLMAGLLAGIIATVLNLVYDFIFRDYTGFSLSGLINVSSIIFVILSVVVAAGIIYYFIARYLKPAFLAHMIIWILLTWLCAEIARHVQRSENPEWVTDLRQLFLGFIFITCGITAVLIPYFVKYDRNIL